MPHLSTASKLAILRRRLVTDRLVDALLVVLDHEGSEVSRHGGLWNARRRRYSLDRPAVPHYVKLERSQCENIDGTPGIAHGFRRWADAVRVGDAKRARLLVAWGNRGSGKTWFLSGVGFVAIALDFPREYSFGVNLTSAARRECIEAIREVARPEWVTRDVEDLREPFTEFLTGHRVNWASAQNPKRLRQAKLPIRYVLLNEGQDQAERNYNNALGAIRNRGGLVAVATNKPQEGAGDWVATICNAITGDEVGHRGEIYQLDNKMNSAVDQVALDDISILIGAVNKEAQEADMGSAAMKLSGPMAYPSFKALPIHKGGNIGDPPPVQHLGRPPWRDVTREKTREEMQGGEGMDWVICVDFQRRPGIVGVCCKLYVVESVWDLLPLPPGTPVMWAGDIVCCPGDESAFSAMLERKGYTPQGVHPGGTPGPSALIVGDATGARQNAAHRWELPPSFAALRFSGGWTVVPPQWSRNRRPWNPLVKERRAQMYAGFESHQILISPRLKEHDEGFASLVESLRRAKVTPRGALLESGGWQHGPDGLGYGWWKFGPRPQPPAPQPPTFDRETFDQLSKVRLFSAE